MGDSIAQHYSAGDNLIELVAGRLKDEGKELTGLKTSDLAAIDEFHIRGRKATLELARRMNLDASDHVLDIGSGLGGPARTLAETCGCRVTGIDLSAAYCEAARVFSEWTGLDRQVSFQQGDAGSMPFDDDRFDAAMTIHVAMNIWAKDRVYTEARRVIRPGGILAIYDVLQGEGGDVIFPVPWAREPSISHLATPAEMDSLLDRAGFRITEVDDSSARSQAWFEEMCARLEAAGTSGIGLQMLLGDDFPVMARNQVNNLAQRRIRTVSYICEA